MQFTEKPASWTAFRANVFGYSRILIHKQTHIHIQYVQCDPTLFPGSEYGSVLDDFWVVQNRHGPFSLEGAPTGTAYPDDDESRNRTHDHWEALLGDLPGAGSGKALTERM